MTLSEALIQTKADYVKACEEAAKCRASGDGPGARAWSDLARIHWATLSELRHGDVTEHESVCHQTPTVHALGAVRTAEVTL
jgi:hypothetical protein